MSDCEQWARADLARRRAWHERQMRRHKRVAVIFVLWMAVLLVAMVMVG